MRVPYVIVDDPLGSVAEGATVPLGEDEQHHLTRVLRRTDGDEVELCDGRGRTVAAVLAGAGAVLTGDVVHHRRPRPDVTVVHAVPKGRGLDEVVRTLAELGVATVVPVVTARTESRPTGARAQRAVARWRAVARAAASQARSPYVCEVASLAPLRPGEAPVAGDAAADEPVGDRRPGDARAAAGRLDLVADPSAPRGIGELLPSTGDVPGAIRVLVGPEGGLTDGELDGLVAAGWEPVRVGDTVLRSVHAATVVVAAAMALAGRYGGRGGVDPRR